MNTIRIKTTNEIPYSPPSETLSHNVEKVNFCHDIGCPHCISVLLLMIVLMTCLRGQRMIVTLHLHYFLRKYLRQLYQYKIYVNKSDKDRKILKEHHI
jgi:hypothetical protein